MHYLYTKVKNLKNNNMNRGGLKKLIITGFSQSGKSTILRFLDYHRQLNVVHSHEKITEIPFYLFNYRSKKASISDKYYKIQKKNFLQFEYRNKKRSLLIDHNYFRKLLNQITGYSQLELHSYLKTIFDHSGTNKKKIEKFDFDFYKFDKTFIKDLYSHGLIKPEKFIDLFYENYFKLYKNHKKQFKKEDYVVFPESNECFQKINFFLKENINFKCIICYRDLKDLLYSKSLRSQNTRKNKNFNLEKSMLGSLYNLDFKKRYYYSLKNFEKLQGRYPEQFILINLDFFLKDTEEHINKICQFLKINKESIMLFPTLAGTKVSKDYYKVGDIMRISNFSLFIELICNTNIRFRKIIKFKFIRYLTMVFYYKAKNIFNRVVSTFRVQF